ncbi:hypothetical protein SLS55_007299 [Diplodia seriata]|uniref:Purine-cytosine permease fcy22 n=1 Tax=Diplodia seriata TaxID=420778 RepID=A0ABR3CBY5_9PEZI
MRDDLEPRTAANPETAMGQDVENDAAVYDTNQPSKRHQNTTSLLRRLTSWGVEVRGIAPVPEKDQTKTQYHNVFFLWLSMLVNLLPIITGMLGTLSYGLSLRDTSLTIIFFSLLCYMPTAYMNVLGPQTGMRQMIQARYSFGFFPVTIVVILNMMTVVGFTVIAGIVAGQTLSAVSDGRISVALGIVLTFVVGLFMSFCGYKVIHVYNRWSWLGVLICFIIMTGCGGKHLSQQVEAEPADAPMILSFGCLIAGFSIAFAGLMSDYSVYYKSTAPATRMFLYPYLAQNLSTILLMVRSTPSIPPINIPQTDTPSKQILGAAIGGAVPNVPAASMYTVTLNWQIVVPWFAHVSRVLFSVVTTAVMIPVAIAAANDFFDSLENFLGVVSYWPAAFAAIVIVEHLHFRKGDSTSYDRDIWKDAAKLPAGLAAITAGVASFGLVIPCMAATWYTGPIAEYTGDIGFEVAFVLAGLLYVPLRTLEIRVQGRL